MYKKRSTYITNEFISDVIDNHCKMPTRVTCYRLGTDEIIVKKQLCVHAQYTILFPYLKSLWSYLRLLMAADFSVQYLYIYGLSIRVGTQHNESNVTKPESLQVSATIFRPFLIIEKSWNILIFSLVHNSVWVLPFEVNAICVWPHVPEIINNSLRYSPRSTFWAVKLCENVFDLHWICQIRLL